MPQPAQTKFNFTEAAITALPFADKGKRYIVRDTATKNFVIRVGETSKIYYLLKNINGRVTYVRLGDAANTNLKSARELLLANMKIVNDGKNPNNEKRKMRQDVTIKEFFDNYFVPSHSNPTHKETTKLQEQSIMRLYLREFHNRRMLDITRGDVERLHKKLGSEVSIYMANHAKHLSELENHFNADVLTYFGGISFNDHMRCDL